MAKQERTEEEELLASKRGKRSSNKGGSHERAIGKKLSLWISHGEKSDLFTRNVLSGGSFTHAAKKGIVRGTPGDLAAAHPAAYAFLQLFEVECKHWRDVHADAILWMNKGELLRVLAKLETRAHASHRSFFLIARQNFRPDIVLMPYDVGMRLSPAITFHGLWSNRIFGCCLDDMITCDPDAFTAENARAFETRKRIIERATRV